MPYITQERREALDHEIQNLALALRNLGFKVGDLNYCITELLTRTITADVSYTNINNAIGVLECTKQELYRRMAGPYEDKCIEKNGDVVAYANVDPREEPLSIRILTESSYKKGEVTREVVEKIINRPSTGCSG